MSTGPDPQTSWPVLSLVERRVLGVLAEKQKTTPDAYPMSLNALVTGCNQKSNRDPILNLAEEDVEDGLLSAQQKGLAVRITGSGRVEKWRHNLYDAWHVDKTEMAVLAEFLLRGPQTEGELRGRVSRMEPVADVDALRNVLRPLAERRLVVYLTPEGRRGTVVTHGFHEPAELERLRKAQPVEAVTLPPSPPSRPPAEPPPREADARHAATQAEVSELRAAVAALQAQVADLGEQVRAIKQGLGI
jgi:uncharacterized protein YceH (UPF0502 family)